jgi:hypothetical protein
MLTDAEARAIIAELRRQRDRLEARVVPAPAPLDQIWVSGGHSRTRTSLCPRRANPLEARTCSQAHR